MYQAKLLSQARCTLMVGRYRGLGRGEGGGGGGKGGGKGGGGGGEGRGKECCCCGKQLALPLQEPPRCIGKSPSVAQATPGVNAGTRKATR